MSLFTQYIQPLTTWLELHPHWALLITCLISLTESLAIIGSIVPGSVTMTAVGILAGSGILRVDLTLLAAIIGAVAGDSLSYACGYIYSERISYLWPFSKYPHWIVYGKEFFAKHGTKSVLIGRFVGPLRSIIPLIAGILHMKQIPFLVANVLSAIGWSFLYVMPGVLIGAAAQDIPAESATRLFILILAFLLAIWLLGILVGHFLKGFNNFLQYHGEKLFLAIKKRPRLLHCLLACAPTTGQKQLYTTLSLLFLIALGLLTSLALIFLQIQGTYVALINKPIYFFLQSIKTPALNVFFITCTQFTSTLTQGCLCLLCFFWFQRQKQLPYFGYVISCVVCAAGLSWLLLHTITSPKPVSSSILFHYSFPALSLTIATALYLFLLYYIRTNYAFFTKGFLALSGCILGFSGLGVLYLGDYWFTDVLAAYSFGATIALLHCLMVRKHQQPGHSKAKALPVFGYALLALCIPTALSTGLHYKTITQSHTPATSLYLIDENQWWSKPQPLLPLYLNSRLGKRAALLNLQYLGDLDWLEDRLKALGWQKNRASFFGKLLIKIGNNSETPKLPLLDLLFENRRPASIMTHYDTNLQRLLIVRIWSSNYYIRQTEKPLWIGSINVIPVAVPKGVKPQPLDFVGVLAKAFPRENQKLLMLPRNSLLPTLLPASPVILLIRE